MYKSYVSFILRTFSLLKMVDWLRYLFVRAKNRRVNEQFEKDNPATKLPPDYFLYETYTLHYQQYIDDGLATARRVIELLKPHIATSHNETVLDWGCGPGRITRHINSLMPSAKVTGIDYNMDYIHWCEENLQGNRFISNSIDPPTTLDNDEFDMVIGLSVFTHFSKELHYRWISELARILKPGGVVLFTTQGESYLEKLTASEKKRFYTGSLVVRDNVLEGNRLFSAFQPKAFMEQLIRDAEFELLEFIPGCVEKGIYVQDIWILGRND